MPGVASPDESAFLVRIFFASLPKECRKAQVPTVGKAGTIPQDVLRRPFSTHVYAHQ